MRIADGRTAFVQWDTGQQIIFDAPCAEAHFAPRAGTVTIDVETRLDNGQYVADVPDELLQTARPVTVYAFVQSPGHYTRQIRSFEVRARPKPADYIYTPTERETWEQLQDQIGDLDKLKTRAKNNLVSAINEAAQSGGGTGDSNIFVIHVSTGEDGQATSETTLEDIETAAAAGKIPLCVIDDSVICSEYAIIGEKELAGFLGMDFDQSYLYIVTFTATEIAVMREDGIYARTTAGGHYTAEQKEQLRTNFDLLSADEIETTIADSVKNISHNALSGRNALNAHPVSAITGLRAELDEKMSPNGEYDTSGLVLKNAKTGAYDVLLACQGVYSSKFRQHAITNAGLLSTLCKGETADSGTDKQLLLNPGAISIADYTVSPNRYLYVEPTGLRVRNAEYPIVLAGKHVDVNDEQVKNVAAPTEDADAANKQYVDEAVAQAGGGGGTTDISLGVTGAAVGQIAKISAVDDNGKPTAWEPADMPSGGGEKPLTLIASYDFDGNTTSVFDKLDLDGLTELIFQPTNVTNATSTDSGLYIRINDIDIAATAIPVKKTGANTGNAGEPWEVLRYNGLFWEVLLSNDKGGGIGVNIVKTYAIINNHAIRDVGPAEKLRLYVPDPTYKPVTGTLEVWGR